MMLPRPLYFTSAKPLGCKKINRLLSPAGLTLSAPGYEFGQGELVDCFDGSVTRAGALVLKDERRVVRIAPDTGITTQAVDGADWRFPADLPQGEISAWLDRITPLRALLPLAEVEFGLQTMALLDDELKTCCRLDCLLVKRGRRSWAWMKSRPMRGYDRNHNALVRALEDLSLPADPLQALKIKGFGYKAKPAVRLDPEAPAIQSLCTLVTAFMDVARKNEAGILADHDTEFLHDWRVSLRKVRSVLSLFKGVFDSGTEAFLKQEFSQIMKETGLLRDRDVYLLSRPEYYRLVPPGLHPGLDILFALLEKERKKAHKSVCRTLKTKAYDRRMSLLRSQFGKPGSLAKGPSADNASRPFCGRLVMKRYEKVCKLAKSITPRTPDDTIHALRIQCKKLRYLIESAGPLYDNKKVKFLIKKLKGMQEHLGNFNDMSVQQETLALCKEKYADNGPDGVKLAESIGALTAMLYRRQLAERQMIIDNLARFYSPEFRALFTTLFA